MQHWRWLRINAVLIWCYHAFVSGKVLFRHFPPQAARGKAAKQEGWAGKQAGQANKPTGGFRLASHSCGAATRTPQAGAGPAASPQRDPPSGTCLRAMEASVPSCQLVPVFEGDAAKGAQRFWNFRPSARISVRKPA